MIVTPAQRKVIHDILAQMLIGINGNVGIIFLYDGHPELGISKEEGRFLRAVMQSEGLITNADGPGKNHLSELTPKGLSIARNPGGYAAFIQKQAEQEQQQQTREQEQLELNRQSVAATVNSTRIAKISAWVAAISLAITMVATYIAYQAYADSSDVNARIQKLEGQMHQLNSKPPPPLPSRPVVPHQ